MPKDDGSQVVEPVADLSNPRETQSMLAYILTIGFLLVVGYAVAKSTTFQDIATVLSSLSPLATMVLAFYFASKAAQQAQAATSAQVRLFPVMIVMEVNLHGSREWEW